MNKQWEDLINKYPETLSYNKDKNMICFEEYKLMDNLDSDIAELIGKSLYVKLIYDEFIDSLFNDYDFELKLYERYEHENCSCDIMLINKEDKLTTKECYVDLMYEAGLWTFEMIDNKDCICIYLNE